MTTLTEFEEALLEQGQTAALTILEKLRERDKIRRPIAPARRISGRKMTTELARHILTLHRNTGMTQQEIAFKLGVNQGRVNEVIKRGKWLENNPAAPEVLARDRAVAKIKGRIGPTARTSESKKAGINSRRTETGQLPLFDV